MIIRKAELRDLKELLEIYNYEVKNGISTLDLEPRTMEEREKWFYMHNVMNHPLYVAELENHIAGYASLSSYRPKEAYKTTVELSIYIGADYRKKGVASALLAYILDEARRDERTHTVVSVITAGNEASRKLHQKFGFEFCGTIKEVGMKFGEYRDIENYSLKV
jgi:L-amino acid N-acyltransferase